eukprot:scaffold264147_cov30-Tisochrysis_lutea.AAC.6
MCAQLLRCAIASWMLPRASAYLVSAHKRRAHRRRSTLCPRVDDPSLMPRICTTSSARASRTIRMASSPRVLGVIAPDSDLLGADVTLEWSCDAAATAISASDTIRCGDSATAESSQPCTEACSWSTILRSRWRSRLGRPLRQA